MTVELKDPEQAAASEPEAIEGGAKLDEADRALLADAKRQLERHKRDARTAELFAFFASLVAIAALLAVAFKLDDQSNSGQISAAPGATPQGTMPAGSPMSGGGPAAASPSAGATKTVSIQLGEMFVKPNVSTVAAGKVTFVAHNSGKMTHELMVERSPIKVDAPGQPNEDAALGMVPDMAPGESGRMTLNLRPGTYELFCNIPGHYAAGQHVTFTVQ